MRKPQTSSSMHANSECDDNASLSNVGHGSLWPRSRSELIHNPNLPSLVCFKQKRGDQYFLSIVKNTKGSSITQTLRRWQ